MNAQPNATCDLALPPRLNPVLAEVLALRGINDPKLATFAYKPLPPTGMLGLDAAARTLADAIQAHAAITIVCDYDCDGATACTIGMRGLGALGADVGYVVPNRRVHGYGLTPPVADLVHQRRPFTKVLVTVDNGIAAHAGVARAKELGMTVVVTDHHLPGDTLPEADVIVDPNQHGCPFGSKAIAGCGVMYYVLAATRNELALRGADVSPCDLPALLDILALGTVADVVPLDATNRWFVWHGLRHVQRGTAHAGINALFDVARRSCATASSHDFGFSIGPRLNAAGRMDDMTVGIRCLLTDDTAEARTLAASLDATNRQRRTVEDANLEEALAQTDAAGSFSRVAYSPSFHEGVVGLVAARLRERDHVPAVAFAPALQEGMLKGSARSIPSLHIRDALDLVNKRGHDFIPAFGGHSAAAGLSLRLVDLDRFKALFDAVCGELLHGKVPDAELHVDGMLAPEDINVDTARALHGMPWGRDFEEPVWKGRFRVLDQCRVGPDAKHLKLTLDVAGKPFKAMRFFAPDGDPEPGTEIDLNYTLGYEVFREKEQVTLIDANRRV
ncbi:MAG TPA: single-stranded-DNA-specific exonuclease RecJ [Rhodanobacteraceae bacterium]